MTTTVDAPEAELGRARYGRRQPNAPQPGRRRLVMRCGPLRPAPTRAPNHLLICTVPPTIGVTSRAYSPEGRCQLRRESNRMELVHQRAAACSQDDGGAWH
jgi:hypothetical protein